MRFWESTLSSVLGSLGGHVGVFYIARYGKMTKIRKQTIYNIIFNLMKRN